MAARAGMKQGPQTLDDKIAREMDEGRTLSSCGTPVGSTPLSKAFDAKPPSIELTSRYYAKRPTSCFTSCRERWQLFKTYMSGLKTLITSAPWVLVVPLLVLVIMVVAAEVGLVLAAAQYSNQRHSNAQFTVSGAAQEVALKLQNMVAPNVALVTAIRTLPHVPTLARNFAATAEGMLKQFEATHFVQQLVLQPWGVIVGKFPNILLADVNTIGTNLFTDAKTAGFISGFVAQGVDFITISGPVPLETGGFGLACAMVVAIPNAAANETFGNDETFTVPFAPDTILGNTTRPDLLPSCGSVCGPTLYKDGVPYRFWGLVTSVVQTKEISTRLSDLEQQSVPYKYVLSRDADFILKNALWRATYGDAVAEPVVFATPVSRSPIITSRDAPECAQVRVAGTGGITWSLCISPLDGWDAPWLLPLQIMVAVVSVIIAGLLFGTLASQERHSVLVRRMLPPKVIRDLNLGRTYAEPFKQVTILFADIVSFTSLSSELSPIQLVDLLNDLYSHFDTLVDKHGLYKVMTIGDAFMCIGGAPEPCHPQDAAIRVARMALDMVEFTRDYVSSDGRSIQIRVGMYTGDVTAAVVGRKMPQTCFIGDAVNVASRMESNSRPMHVQVGTTTAQLLTAQSEFHLEARGELDIKGKGRMSTFFLWPSSVGLDNIRLASSEVDPVPSRRDDSGSISTKVVQSPVAGGLISHATG